LFLSKEQKLENGNWNGMQPLQKNYDLSHIWVVKYIFIIKFSFLEFCNLFYIYPRIIWKKIANSEFYNLFIYQFQRWLKTM
jgi:hypothetical protein